MTPARAFAAIGLGLAVTGAIGTAVVRYASPVPIHGAFGFNELTQVDYLVEGLAWASVGALLVMRRPANAVGWFMVLIGVGYSLSQVSVALAFTFAADGTAEGQQSARLAGWVTVLLQLVAILQVAIGFIFPTGHTQSRGWARFMGFFWAFAAVFVAFGLFQSGPLQLLPDIENPFGFAPDLRSGQPIAPYLMVGTVIALTGLLLSMVTRYRSSGAIERQQLRWFALALSVSAVGLCIAQVETTVIGRPSETAGLTIFVFAGAVVPVAIGIAILRYHLYAIDRIVSRTIAYSIVVGGLAIAFYALVIVLSAVLAKFAQGGAIAVAVSTLAVFAAFQVIARPIRHRVDRRFNRAHYDAEQMAIAFSIRLRDEVDLAMVVEDLAATVRKTVDPASTTLWLRPTSRDHMKTSTS